MGAGSEPKSKQMKALIEDLLDESKTKFRLSSFVRGLYCDWSISNKGMYITKNVVIKMAIVRHPFNEHNLFK